MSSELIFRIIIWAIPVVFSIVVHEVAHGWMAYRLGDSTAKDMGRLTLNPLPHIDIMGTVLLPLIMLFLGGPVFGWAKPVPFNPQNFYPYIDIRRGTMWVALAGPGSNLALAFIASFILVLVQRLFSSFHPLVYIPLLQVAQAFILINLVLAFLNLIPIPPLDGSKVLMRFMPSKYYNYYFMLERYGFLIIVILLASGVLSHLILGPVGFFHRIFLLIPRSIF